MILPLLFQISILLSWQTNVSAQPLALTTKSTYSISIPFPFAEGVYRCIDLWFHSDSIFDMFLRKNIDVELEVHEFSIQENHGYIVKYCRTKASLGNINGEGRNRDCEFGFFLNEIWLESISNSREEANKLGAVLRALGWYKSSDSPYFLSAFDHGYSDSLFPMVKENSNQRNTTLPLEIGTGIFIRFDGKRRLLIKIKKRKDIKTKMELFKRNGGLLLQKQLSSSDGTIHRCQIFNSDELNVATEYFNVNRELGNGGQGAVYKGILEDGRMVAIKKPKVVGEEKIKEFVNEVVILSQINHRNVVKLLGCCLETEVPILVYEFISNGTLFEFLHDQCENIPFTWDMRLRIAIEVSQAVSYLHFEASSPIIHRDIKSTNILLDNRFKAKVADFGISRIVAIHQTHLTTKVQGTLGYLDPEYHQTSQLTDKSDVYSFGIILVELLTGQKPIFSTASQENINLGTYFLHCMKENCLKDVLDARVREAYTRKQGEKHEMKQGEKHEILAFAQIALSCLNMNGRERPTMKEVSTTLEAIRASRKKQSAFNRIMKELIK